MGLPWSRAETPEQDHGHALEDTAFQGVSVCRDPAEHPGSPPGVDTHSQTKDRNVPEAFRHTDGVTPGHPVPFHLAALEMPRSVTFATPGSVVAA